MPLSVLFAPTPQILHAEPVEPYGGPLTDGLELILGGLRAVLARSHHADPVRPDRMRGSEQECASPSS